MVYNKSRLVPKLSISSLLLCLYISKMASVSRLFTRMFQRRTFATASSSGLTEEMLAEQLHAKGTMKTWKLVSIFVAAPAIMFCIYNSVKKEMALHEQERPEFLSFAHLRIRTKPFPWGDGNHSLFHNGHSNALPEGFEDEH